MEQVAGKLISVIDKSCEKCRGGCCRKFRVEVTGNDDVSWNMIYVRANTYWMRKQKDRMTCVALARNGKCTIYDKRPQVCKDFSIGESRCVIIQKERKREWHT